MIITFTGPSGGGKTAIAKEIIAAYPNAKPLTSTTTRTPRPSDLPGDFEYLDRETFNRLRDEGAFAWTADVGSTSHGTRAAWLKKALTDDQTISIMILVPSVLPALYAFADELGSRDAITSFFIHVPDEGVLRERMRIRGDAPESIEERLTVCHDFEEEAKATGVDFVWVDNSGKLQDAVKTVTDHLSNKQ
jgi:guanylate kinase